MRVSKYDTHRKINMPIYGAGVDVVQGALVKRGTTPGTDNGALILASGSSAIPDIVGVLGELHDFSVTDDTLINGTKYVTHPVDLAFPSRILTVEISQATADLVTVTSDAAGTTLTITSLEDDIDASFIYVAAGAGIGQLQFLTASAAGSATLKAAFTTALVASDSKIIKVLRRFHALISFTSDGVKMSSQAAAGAVAGLILDIRMLRGERDESLDPTKHPGMKNLNNARVKFVADIIIRDTAAYTVD